jgi:hypothetical protein
MKALLILALTFTLAACDGAPPRKYRITHHGVSGEVRTWEAILYPYQIGSEIEDGFTFIDLTGKRVTVSGSVIIEEAG